MLYRPEIDGIRAIAVISVILFHANSALLTGGFVGVDIFFVISGFLITTIIINHHKDENFNTRRFYERRVRRILPALFLTLLCTLPAAYALLLPSQLVTFSQSLLAVIGLVSNLFFGRSPGYFEPSAAEQPLLHTWSLAVEEQFYLFFPLLLSAVWRHRSRWAFWLVIICAALSLAYAEWGWRERPTANFFRTTSRVWELMAGSAAAIWTHDRKLRGNEALATIGLAMILFSLTIYTEATPSPSSQMLLPVVGTILLLLWGTNTTFVGSLLSSRPLVTIGLISYSAYLFHQPIFAFIRIRWGDNLPTLHLTLATAAILVLAGLSWRLVEQPFRSEIKIRGAKLLGLSLGGWVLFAAAGLIGIAFEGFPNRTSSDGRPLKDFGYISARNETIGLDRRCEGFVRVPECGFGSPREVLVWGDSYAKHAVPFVQALEEKDVSQAAQSSCTPFLNTLSRKPKNLTAKELAGCDAFDKRVLSHLVEDNAIHTLVLGSRFFLLSEASEEEVALIASEFLSQINALKSQLGRPLNITLFPPPPTPLEDVSKCVDRLILFGGTRRQCDFKLSAVDELSSRQLAFVKLLAAGGMEVYPLYTVLCPDDVCMPFLEEVRIYRDNGHLRNAGSTLLAQKFRRDH